MILNYYGGNTVLPGQYWRFAVRLNRPHGFSNPGGFDYEAWLFQQGVSARGYVRDSASNQLISAPSKGVGFLAIGMAARDPLLAKNKIAADVSERSIRWPLDRAAAWR